MEYRNDMEAVNKDNHEYVDYLLFKKSKKIDAIKQLSATNMDDIEKLDRAKKALQSKHVRETNAISTRIADLDKKLLSKQKEFSSLQDIVDKSAKHYSDIAVIKAEVDQYTRDYKAKIAELGDELVNQRILLQSASERQIEEIKQKADEKAVEYLAEHCTNIKNENLVLKKKLAQLTVSTMKMMEKKEKLKLSVLELEREQKIKAGLASLRLKKIVRSERKSQ
jgi:hypothetical protein